MIANRKELQKGFLLIFTLLLGIVAVLYGKHKMDTFSQQPSELLFSNGSGFYTQDITVKVTMDKEGSIFYTRDGTEPDREHTDSTMEYREPLQLSAGSEVQVQVYRFKAYYADGTESDIVTNTYFMGNKVQDRYDTLVMSISTDPDNLYGYENGIFVEGKIRDEYLEEHPDEEIDSDTPSNFNLRGKESERRIHLELFESTGERVLSQDCGMRTSGGATRESEQKSFKIYSRYEYSEDNKFRYPFFRDERQEGTNVLVNKFECLKIRNTGNDRLEAFIRDELGMRLSDQAGMQDVQYVRPVSVYMNGTYQGLYWIHSVYDDSYFKERYGKYDGEMVVLGQQEGSMSTDNTKEIENQYAEEYNTWYESVCMLDMNQEENYEMVENTIDVENFLQYMAAEVYMANQDWPHNNEKVYRYVSEDNHYQEGTVFDGRYRYLIYDTDTAMGARMIVDTMNASQSFETLQNLVDNRSSNLFASLIEREDCRTFFVGKLCELMNGAFSYENVCKTLDAMDAERDNEMQAYIRESERNENLMDISDYYTGMQMDCIKEWARVTPDNLVSNLSSYWDLGEAYKLGVVTSTGVSARVNDLLINSDEFIGTYFTGCETILRGVIPEGRKFVYWQINGELYYEEDVKIEEDMLVNGIVYAIMVVSDSTEKELSLTTISSKGENDYIELSNVTAHPVDTAGYYVADKESTSHMNYLPQMTLEPGQSIRIVCRSYYKGDSDAVMRTNFNLSKDERVILGHSQKGILEMVTIPDVTQEHGCYKKTPVTEEWKEVFDDTVG